jgi:hypothetical protein
VVELRLSDLTAVKQLHSETVTEYLKRLRKTRNRCFDLTIGEKDVDNLIFPGLVSYLKERLEGQEFFDINQVLQWAVTHENWARDHMSHGPFWENTPREREQHNVNCVNDESASDEETEICVAEWVDTPKDKPISCSFLKPNNVKNEEMQFTFDVNKFDKLFNVVVKGGVIRLAEGHVIPATNVLAKRKFCRLHDSYSHSTNECNYFCRQVQSAINDGQLTLSDGNKMRLDVEPFRVNTVDLEGKRVLVHSDQAATMKGKNVVVSDEPRHRMIKPHNPEVGTWKENVRRKPERSVRPTSSMLKEKYVMQQQQQRGLQSYLGWYKRERSPGYHNVRYGARRPHAWRVQRLLYRNLIWRTPHAENLAEAQVRGNPTSGGRQDEPKTRESDAILFCGEEENPSGVTKSRANSYVLVGSVLCKISSEVHMDGRRVVTQARGKSDDHAGTSHTEREPKCAWIVSVEGCEIVGPGYSDPTAADSS